MFLVVGLTSCEGDQCSREGDRVLTLVDYNSTDPVEGATVHLIKDDQNGASVAFTTTTDETGTILVYCNYNVDAFSVAKEGYYNEIVNKIFIEEIMHEVYEMHPKAWVKIHAVDEEPYETDGIQFSSSHGNTSGILLGGEHDYFVIMAVVGNSEEPLIARKFHNSWDPPYFKEYLEIVAAPGDTAVYTYYY